MHRLILILVALVFGCNLPTGTTQPATRAVPTTASSTQVVRRPIELHYGIYLARLDLRIAVSPEGVLRSVRTDSKSYGGNDIDPKNERVEVREGKLTAEQVAELARLFTGWDSLSATPYGGVPDGGDISIRYGEKTVSGGSAVPKQVTDARIHVMELARSMPEVKPVTRVPPPSHSTNQALRDGQRAGGENPNPPTPVPSIFRAICLPLLRALPFGALQPAARPVEIEGALGAPITGTQQSSG